MILQDGAYIEVSPSQSAILNTKLTIAGVTRQYLVYPTEGHGWVGANLVDSFNKIRAFLTTYVN